MKITDTRDKSKINVISIVDNSTRRNPIAVAARSRYANTNAAGFHETTKYTRKTKHKPIIY